LELGVFVIVAVLIVVVVKLPGKAVEGVSSDDVLVSIVPKDDDGAVEVLLGLPATADDDDIVEVTSSVEEKISEDPVARMVLV